MRGAYARCPDQSDIRLDMFFFDYQLAPLFVQEIYPRVQPYAARNLCDHLDRLSVVADSIGRGDLIHRRIYSGQKFELLPQFGMASCVIPGVVMRGGAGRVEFPKVRGLHIWVCVNM